MAKYYALGNYTTQGFQGFIKDPKSDRSKAAQVAAEAVGAKMVSYTGLRGAYDFFVIFEGNFDQAAAIKMATEASGALCNITILEEININNVANHASKIAAAYKGPGQ
jgi:uncharacterized protein with GYD domain|tara:strand:- start:969 stop:1292 length:324 start_codon:yes stop_codon:yes gene_type:complete